MEAAGSRDHDNRKRRRAADGAASDGSLSSDDDDARDDTVGHLRIGPGEFITERYRVVRESGKGTFGRVLLCEDVTASAGSPRAYVAIKVVRKIRKYTEAAHIEADILEDVNRADPAGASHNVRFHTAFDFCGHFCLVFEALGPSLYDYIKANEYRPPPLYCVQAFADQLLAAVAFLHGMRLIHTDLKLENVLLVSRAPFAASSKQTSVRNATESVLAPASTDIKLIDYGGATYDWEHKSSLINTRQYRAPEVIFGLGWSMESDVWSLGCILMELYTGELLFQTVRALCPQHLPSNLYSFPRTLMQHDNAEHVALMDAILGPLPDGWVRGHYAASREVRKLFNRYGRQRYPETAPSKDSLAHVRDARRLEDLVHPRDTVFLDLVRQLLTYVPSRRISAREALNHRFFSWTAAAEASARRQLLGAVRLTSNRFF